MGNLLWRNRDDYGYSCATDASGNIYLAGRTSSTRNCHNRCSPNYIGGGTDAFLVKFNSSGVRQWGTYYGGTGMIWLFLRHRCQWNIYLSGYTNSTSGIATTGAHQTTYGGGL